MAIAKADQSRNNNKYDGDMHWTKEYEMNTLHVNYTSIKQNNQLQRNR